ncbi:MAG: hypothetical protein RR996_06740 [Alistipes sp.]
MIISVTPELYRQMSNRLCEAIGASDYFSDTICFVEQEVESRLTASILVYHRTECAPDGVWRPITDLVPVWWEFHTVVEGVEVLNDFDFNELKTYII